MSQSDALEYRRPLMAIVNDEIDRLHGSLNLPDSEFFCECADPRCAERVRLSRQEFAALRAQSRALLVAAHVNRASSAPPTAQGGSET